MSPFPLPNALVLLLEIIRSNLVKDMKVAVKEKRGERRLINSYSPHCNSYERATVAVTS